MAFHLKMVLAFFLQLMMRIWRLFFNNTNVANLAMPDLKDKIQINAKLCKRLNRKLVKTRKLIDHHSKPSGTQKKVLHELKLVMKRGEELLELCMCKKTKSWLFSAVTLTDIKEDVLEIELDIAWWTSMLGMSTANHLEDFEEDNDVIKALEQLKTCYDKLSNQNKSLQKTAIEDNERLKSKLEEERFKHAKGTEQHFLTVYLLCRLKDSQGDSDIPITDIEFLDKHFRNYLKRTKTLAGGAFGLVYGVTWLREFHFRKWAMKIIFNVDERRPEGRFLKFCSHPHIVQFIWSWEQRHFENLEDKKFPHIMMELMPMDLSTLIEEKMKNKVGPPFEEHVAIDIMLQIAKAVRYLHSKKVNIGGIKSKITHRDLKPKNVLVEPCGTMWKVKLTDFGISKVYYGTETQSTQTSHQGTSVYAAPEVFLLEDGSIKPKFPPKIDVWSFAMICSEIFTGHPPFTGYFQKGLHLKIKEEGIRPHLPPKLPDYVRFCITSCWNLDPQQRPNFLNICRMLNLAKAMSLGVLPLDFRTKPLFQPSNPMWQIQQLDVYENIASRHSTTNFQVRAPNHEVREKYFLVGTNFKIYVDEFMKEELLDQDSSYKIGIQGVEDEYKSLNLVKRPIMQGSLWTSPLEEFAYGCFIGIFVSCEYKAELQKMNVKFVMGGYIGETDPTSKEPFDYKCTWGNTTIGKMCNGLRAAGFYSMGEFKKRYVYIYVKYGLENLVVITHLWHDDKLVLGDQNTARSTSTHRIEWGSKILTNFDRAYDHHNYSLTLISP